MHIYMQGAALISDEMWRRLRGGVCVWAQCTHTHRNARNVLLAWGMHANLWVWKFNCHHLGNFWTKATKKLQLRDSVYAFDSVYAEGLPKAEFRL